jgi:hypothetical protein
MLHSPTLFPDELEGVVIDRRNGDDRQNTWEVAQILALTEDTFFACLRNEAGISFKIDNFHKIGLPMIKLDLSKYL